MNSGMDRTGIQFGYDRTIMCILILAESENCYDLIKLSNPSFGLVTIKLFLLQLPPCPDPFCLFGRIRAIYASQETILSALFYLFQNGVPIPKK